MTNYFDITRKLKQEPRNWTINGKNNTNTNFVVGVTMATSPKKEIYIYGRRKAKLIQHYLDIR